MARQNRRPASLDMILYGVSRVPLEMVRRAVGGALVLVILGLVWIFSPIRSYIRDAYNCYFYNTEHTLADVVSTKETPILWDTIARVEVTYTTEVFGKEVMSSYTTFKFLDERIQPRVEYILRELGYSLFAPVVGDQVVLAYHPLQPELRCLYISPYIAYFPVALFTLLTVAAFIFTFANVVLTYRMVKKIFKA